MTNSNMACGGNTSAKTNTSEAQQVNLAKLRGINFLTRYVNDINDDDLRLFTIYALENMVPDYFWTCAASSSGNYHPKFSLGEAGLIMHTIAVLEWVKRLQQLDHLKAPEYNDEVIVASILHDSFKRGNEENIDHTHKSHPHIAAINIMDLYNGSFSEKYPKVNIQYKIGNICNIISTHMGQWGVGDQFYPNSPAAMLVHLADYMSSSKVHDFMEELKIQE